MSVLRSQARWFVALAMLVLVFMAMASRFGPGRGAAISSGGRAGALAQPAGELAAQAGAGPDWWPTISEQLATEEYHASIADDGLQAPNRAQNLRTRFEADGIAIEPRVLGGAAPAWRFGWETAALGRPGQMSEVAPAVLHADGARVRYERPGFCEWYENTPEGVEQGFTIARPPSGAGPLRIAGTLAGGLRAELADGAVYLFDPEGVQVLRYSHLLVEDANGRDLPAWLALTGQMLAIEVDDRDAAYPLIVDPLLTAPSWTTEGNQAQSDYGNSVATAGDVNNDGYSDVIVGASQYDNGQADEGRVFLYLGSSAGLAVTPAWTAESNVAGARFGGSVASAGDVNADHCSDIAVGAWLFANGQSQEGKAYVYHGSPTGPAATPAWSVEGNQEFAYFGFTVVMAGDVNRDGFGDVVVGHPGYSNGELSEGRALVYHGSQTGLGLVPAWAVESGQTGANFGIRVATAGDVNGDGYADVIVGADAFDNGQLEEGRAFVYHGSASGLAAAPAWIAESDQANANFGRAVATAGDVNGDGYSDVIVGSPSFDDPTLQEGIVLVYHGSPTGLNTEAAWTAEGDHSLAIFGTSVACAGDVNGDGYSDVLVGSPGYDNELFHEGRTYLYYGSAGGLSTGSWMAEGNQDNAYFGQCVAAAGDVDGDGFSDAVIGAVYFDNGEVDEGRALLYRGSPAGLAPVYTWGFDGGQLNAGMGWVIAGAGDVNGDGYSDMLVIADRYDSGQVDEGKAWIYLGTGGPTPILVWSAETNQFTAQLSAGSTAGDVNGDGYSDVLLGSYHFDNGQTDEGRAYLYLGSPSGPSFSPAWSVESDQASAELGWSLASAGDVNGDGYADVIVGADAWDNAQNNEGRALIYLGSASGLSPVPARTIESDQDGALLGYSVAGGGDVNRDGYSDVLIGVPTYHQGQANEGVVWVFHGSAAGIGGSPSRVVQVDQDGATFGNSVASAGDVNGDGYSDAVIGASAYSGGQPNEGRAYVYHGGAGGLAALPAWTSEPDQTSASFGYTVAGAGDVNADGYSEVIVGAPFYDNGLTNEGAAWLYAGSPSGLGGPVWTTEGNQPNVVCGRWVAGLGDVNGDGYSDVGVGIPGFIGAQNGEGRGKVFFGGYETGGQAFLPGAQGLTRVPRQLRTDGSTPIQVLGTSDSPSGFRLQVLARLVGGRGQVRLQWEVKPASVPFDGLGLGTGLPVDTGLPGPNGSAVVLSQLVLGLTPASLYHWRLRVLTDSPFYPHSPWFWLPDNAASEPDVRTAPGVAAASEGAPVAGARLLEPAAPNPFRTQTRVAYTVPAPGRVRLGVYDVQGRCVRELSHDRRAAGQYAVAWDGRNAAGAELPSGIYFVRLELAGQVTAEKVVLER
jgi:hypothetical protein